MARPVNADADATRQRILNSALTLFSGHGLDGTSVRDIARGADVSLAMVHHYFGSKDGLYDACIAAMDAELAVLRGELEAELLHGGSVPSLVQQAIARGFAFTRAHQVGTRLLMRQVVATGELGNGRREGMQLPFLRRSSELLAGALGRAPEELRLPLQSVVALIVRYALSNDRELCDFAGADTVADAELRVVRHLTAVARALLALPSPNAN